jgi:oligopeptide transport system ATP-binding protein
MSELLSVQNLVKNFPIKKGYFGKEGSSVKAVSDVSFNILRGETLGLVGESGCGKSTLGRCILRLIEPTEGKIFFKGQNVRALDSKKLRLLRRSMQIIFQDPYASLNPRMTVEEILKEPLDIHKLYSSKAERYKKILKLLDVCGLRKESVSRYPHEFSGGQRQRICIARALAVEPEFIVCDEPVSALDVSIQAQIINLMQDLQKEFGLTYLFIAHDLNVVQHISTRVAVMYLGKIVEISSGADLFAHPKHPYTQALLSAIPSLDLDRKKERIILKGDVPSPIHLPKGCYFHLRCPIARQNCQVDSPNLREVGSADSSHCVSCHYA